MLHLNDQKIVDILYNSFSDGWNRITPAPVLRGNTPYEAGPKPLAECYESLIRKRLSDASSPNQRFNILSYYFYVAGRDLGNVGEYKPETAPDRTPADNYYMAMFSALKNMGETDNKIATSINENSRDMVFVVTQDILQNLDQMKQNARFTEKKDKNKIAKAKTGPTQKAKIA